MQKDQKKLIPPAMIADVISFEKRFWVPVSQGRQSFPLPILSHKLLYLSTINNVTIQPPLQKHKAYRKQQRKQP